MGLLASFSKWVHWSGGRACRGPASRSSTSRPRPASSLATTGPPPPAPTTMTSRIPHLRASLVVATEVVPAVGGAGVAREVPADGPGRERAGRRVEHVRLAERAQGGQLQQGR